MKIAVCLSGQMRTAEKCVDRIKEFFSDYYVDYFMHTWNQEEEYFKESDKMIKPRLRNLDLGLFEKVKSILDAKVATRDDKIQVEYPSVFAQQLSMLKCFEQCQQYSASTGTQYDIIIKCRFDLIWRPCMRFSIPDKFSNDTLYASGIERGKILDRFFFGSPKVMEPVLSIFRFSESNLPKMRIRGFPNSPEEILYKFVNQYLKVKVSLHEMQECIVRPNCMELDVIRDFEKIDQLGFEFYNVIDWKTGKFR